MSYSVFQQIATLCPDLPTFPVQGIRVTGAFRSRSQKVSHQISVSLSIDVCNFVYEFLVIPDLSHAIILGSDFLRAFDISLNVVDGRFRLLISQGDQVVEVSERDVFHVPSPSLKSLKLCAVSGSTTQLPPLMTSSFGLDSIQIGTTLSAEERAKLFRVLQDFREVFSDQPGRTNCYQHSITLLDSQPFAVKQYPIPRAHRRAVEEQIAKMEEWGVISRSDTPYSSPLLTTVKKDGSVRICLDARRLNSVMQSDCELPRPVDDILHSLGAVKFISSIDLTSSYWQIPIVPEHRHYTGFRVGTRSYQFNVLPFGLKTAVSSFTRCMDLVLREMSGDFVHAYVDDLIIVSSSFSEHLQHISRVLSRLRECGFTLRLDKCSFFRESVKFLGYVLDVHGLKPDPNRIQGLVDFPPPTNVRQLQAFLGLVNYDRGFVPHVSSILEPLTRLLHKGVSWIWGHAQQEAFERIKNELSETILLHHPDPNLSFIVQADASDVGLGAVLFQEVNGVQQVVAYASRLLLDRERRYTTSENGSQLKILQSGRL